MLIKNKDGLLDGIIFRELEWDTNHFGLKSCLIDIQKQLNNIDIANIKKIIERYEFVTIKIKKIYSNSNIKIKEIDDLYLIDINVQFEKNSNYKENFIDSNKCKISKIINIYEANLILKSAFKDSRFIKDPNLNSEKSIDMYKQWVKNSINDRNKFFILSQNDTEKINGFILASISENNEILIELIAVDKLKRRVGIGKSLIEKLVDYSIENNISKVKVGTQIENIEAMNFYSKCGFKIKDITYIYHKVNKEDL